MTRGSHSRLTPLVIWSTAVTTFLLQPCLALQDARDTQANLTVSSDEEQPAAALSPSPKVEPPDEQLTEEQQADLNLWTSALNQSPGGSQTQETAARRLVDSGWPQAHAVLARQLASALSPPEVIQAICRAVTESRRPPQALVEPLLEALAASHGGDDAVKSALVQTMTAYPHDLILPALIDRASGRHEEESDHSASSHDAQACRLTAIAALSMFAEIDAVDALISCLAAEQPDDVRAAAGNSLREITGLAVNGDWTIAEWSEWWESRREFGREGLLTNAVRELRSRLADFMHRVQTLERDQQQLLSELVASLERQYWLNPQADRPALLVSFLAPTSRKQVRLLGLRLVERAVSNAEVVPTPVIESVAAMVGDADPQLRAGALRRLVLVDGERTAALVAQGFAKERDTVALQAMLTVLTSHPVASTIPGLMQLVLNSDPSLHADACRSLIAAARADLIDGPGLSEVADALSEQALADGIAQLPSHLQPIDIELLCWTRGSHEMAAVIIRQILSGQVLAPETYPAAAARGASQADGSLTGDLIAAAANPQVFPWAVAAIQKRDGVSIAALRSLISMPSPTRADRLDAINRAMLDLPMDLWIAADDAVAGLDYIDLPQRIAWLARILELREGTPNPNESGTPQGQVRRAVCLRLAQLYLDNCNPASALMALQAAPADDSDLTQFANATLVAQLMQGMVPPEPNEQSDVLPVTVIMEAIERLLTCDDESAAMNERLAVLSAVMAEHQDAPPADGQLRARYEALLQHLGERLVSVPADDVGEDEDAPDDPQQPQQATEESGQGVTGDSGPGRPSSGADHTGGDGGEG